ncbi:MAG: type II toxin-antitoxin system VapC family toxin [Jatrophihabitantaceae bacterium]
MGPSLMADLLVDTDVCIDHLNGVARLPGRRARLSVSVITRAELLAGAKDAGDVAFVRRLLASMIERAVDRQIAEEAGRIRAETAVRLPDALIAATALVHGLTLHTRNVRDFKRVPGLRLRSTR